jgi:hypothetical protein
MFVSPSVVDATCGRMAMLLHDESADHLLRVDAEGSHRLKTGVADHRDLAPEQADGTRQQPWLSHSKSHQN